VNRCLSGTQRERFRKGGASQAIDVEMRLSLGGVSSLNKLIALVPGGGIKTRCGATKIHSSSVTFVNQSGIDKSSLMVSDCSS
jgi:hypothetical protein